MSGFQSPDVPAYICYALVFLVGMIVARSSVDTLLDRYPDRWAFAGTWSLFAAYTILPIALFWFLDYTSIIHDTTLFAAIAIAVLYPQIFAGGVQGIVMPGQTAALWKPFEGWTKHVEDRISNRNKRYRDRFDEDVRARIAASQDRMDQLEALARERSQNVAALAQDLNPLMQAVQQNAPGSQRRLVERLWRDLREAEPENYGYLLRQRRFIDWWTYWRWLEKGQSKLISSLIAIGFLLCILIGYRWLVPYQDRGFLAYYQWRFLKVEATDRDKYRSRRYLAQALQDNPAKATIIVRPLIDELTFKGIARRQIDDTHRFIVGVHSVDVNKAAIPLLIKSLRTENADVRLGVQQLLLDLQKADYPQFSLDGDPFRPLLKWMPNDKETPGEVEGFVQLWLQWWRATQVPPPSQGTEIEKHLETTGKSELPGLFFEFNSAIIRPESEMALKQIVSALTNNPGWKLEIDGYTDSAGSDKYNQSLSERRAIATVQALVQRYGVKQSRLSSKGFGSSHPKASNETQAGRSQNRRVELVRLPA
jgi:outer membrane protein OmpA-like peptidoglycan-associated protein